jgi:hypothetical protein
MASCFARLRRAADPDTGMPSDAVLATNEIDGPGMRQQARFLIGSRAGTIVPACGPFNPMGEGPLQENMQLVMEADRVHERIGLLKQIDQLQRGLDTRGDMDAVEEFRRQALDVIFGGIREAFDILKEDPNGRRVGSECRARAAYSVGVGDSAPISNHLGSARVGVTFEPVGCVVPSSSRSGQATGIVGMQVHYERRRYSSIADW